MHCFCRKFCIFFKYSSHVELSIFRFMQMFINAFIFHNIWTSLFWHFLIPVLSVFCIANLCKFKFTSVLYRHTDEIKKDLSQEATLWKPCQEPHTGTGPGTNFLSLNLPVLVLLGQGPGYTTSEVFSAPVAIFMCSQSSPSWVWKSARCQVLCGVWSPGYRGLPLIRKYTRSQKDTARPGWHRQPCRWTRYPMRRKECGRLSTARAWAGWEAQGHYGWHPHAMLMS